jgi:hypothetical protein
MKWDYSRTILAKFGLNWFSGFREEDLNQNMPNLHNLYKSKSSSLKPLNQVKPNLAGVVPFQNCV